MSFSVCVLCFSAVCNIAFGVGVLLDAGSSLALTALPPTGDLDIVVTVVLSCHCHRSSLAEMTIHGMNIVMVIHQPRLNNYLVCDQVGPLLVPSPGGRKWSWSHCVGCGSPAGAERAPVRDREVPWKGLPPLYGIGCCALERTAATVLIAQWPVPLSPHLPRSCCSARVAAQCTWAARRRPTFTSTSSWDTSKL